MYLFKNGSVSRNLDSLCNYNKQNTFLKSFIKFFIRDGLFTKTKFNFGIIFKNLNFNIYENNLQHLSSTYADDDMISIFLSEFLSKKKNFLFLLSATIDLLKPPFIVKSIIVPKKIRKKSKIKYSLKIIYKNEGKRIRNSFKQIYYFSNNFNDSKYSVRVFKSFFFLFFNWKNSDLYKLKLNVFKKFLNIQ